MCACASVYVRVLCVCVRMCMCVCVQVQLCVVAVHVRYKQQTHTHLQQGQPLTSFSRCTRGQHTSLLAPRWHSICVCVCVCVSEWVGVVEVGVVKVGGYHYQAKTQYHCTPTKQTFFSLLKQSTTAAKNTDPISKPQARETHKLYCTCTSHMHIYY